MPRRRSVVKRELLPDPVFNELLVTRTVNAIMSQGKKNIAERMFYGAMDIIKEKSSKDPIQVYKKAVQNVRPMLEVKSRRVGGATYQVPVEVPASRQTSLAVRWIVSMARTRNERGFENQFAHEILDASNNTGNAFKKKEDTHKMAEANKAFSHYRW
ncbi:MAG: 30S ribosomal protein S7 [Nitrospinae bacterium]|nr:30S ribosomal protein S7 [Nitrospinota bacterium]